MDEMHKVKHVRFEGFRRLQGVDIEMRPLMVMIGANGVGKTSVLDALSLLSAAAAGTISRRLGEMGGIADVLTRGYLGRITLKAEMEAPGRKPLIYDLQLEPNGPTYSIAEEVLSQDRLGLPEHFKYIESRHNDIRYFDLDTNKLVRPNWEHNPLESSLSQVPKMFQQSEELRRTLSSVTQYHVLDVGPHAPVRLPQQMKPAALPGENGEDLIPFLYGLRESTPDRYEAIEDALRSSFHGFQSLNFPPVAAGMLAMTWKDKNFKSPIYTHQLSEGTLRFLWLVSLLQSPNLPTVTMIDEPEVSLHPELLSLLAELMREASQRTHLVVATHSDRLIRFLVPKEVVVMDTDGDGYATVRSADSLDLEEWLKEYGLDEVWRMGRMGGRS